MNPFLRVLLFLTPQGLVMLHDDGFFFFSHTDHLSHVAIIYLQTAECVSTLARVRACVHYHLSTTRSQYELNNTSRKLQRGVF